ncbi:MAG: helix-turn-helix domain-containing protein [Firmicutes bacterium]|nr:helix-turn-helix domain-containing protein [Bacillota bacterium]
MQFGDILRWLIDENDLKQKQLAEELHIAPSTLGSYVLNTHEPDFALLKRIAAYFHVSTDYLLDYHPRQGETDMEEDLLQVFRQQPPAQQRIYLEQGRTIAKVCAGDKSSV